MTTTAWRAVRPTRRREEHRRHGARLTTRSAALGVLTLALLSSGQHGGLVEAGTVDGSEVQCTPTNTHVKEGRVDMGKGDCDKRKIGGASGLYKSCFRYDAVDFNITGDSDGDVFFCECNPMWGLGGRQCNRMNPMKVVIVPTATDQPRTHTRTRAHLHLEDIHTITAPRGPHYTLKGAYNVISYGTVAILNIGLLGYAAYLAR